MMNLGLIDSMMSRDTLPLNLVPIALFPGFWMKLRWTQEIVTAVSHFLVQNKIRILRTGEPPLPRIFSSAPRET